MSAHRADTWRGSALKHEIFRVINPFVASYKCGTEGGFRVANTYIEERAIELAHYVIENKSTVREAAKKFYISKSTVHKDIVERLKMFDKSLYLEVKKVLDENKAERHLRGGMATKRKYRGEEK